MTFEERMKATFEDENQQHRGLILQLSHGYMLRADCASKTLVESTVKEDNQQNIFSLTS